MRLFILGLYYVLFSIGSLPMYLIAFILGKIDEKKKVAFAQKVVRNRFRIIMFLAGAKLE